MSTFVTKKLLTSVFVGLASCTAAHSRVAGPLPSWMETSTKNAILAFVDKVTKEGSADFVPVPERIATFDTEKPVNP